MADRDFDDRLNAAANNVNNACDSMKALFETPGFIRQHRQPSAPMHQLVKPPDTKPPATDSDDNNSADESNTPTSGGLRAGISNLLSVYFYSE